MSDVIIEMAPQGVFKTIKKISEENFRNEVCGFVGYDDENFVIKEAANIAEDPKRFFLISPLDYLLFKEDYCLVAVFHSHIIADEQPSEFDRKMAENCCNPFLIYSLNTQKINIYEPQTMECDVSILERIKAEQ